MDMADELPTPSPAPQGVAEGAEMEIETSRADSPIAKPAEGGKMGEETTRTDTPVPKPAKTPKKRKTPMKAKGDEDTGYDADASPAKKAKATPKPRQRKTPNKPVQKALPLANSYELCPEQDKMLVDMRDEGKSWDEIRKAWENLTGEKMAQSTLPNRYSRLKSNFVIISDEDSAKLIEAKHDIDAEYEREKWNRIAERMVAKGAESYKGDAIKRQYQKLMVTHKDLREEVIEQNKKVAKEDEAEQALYAD